MSILCFIRLSFFDAVVVAFRSFSLMFFLRLLMVAAVVFSVGVKKGFAENLPEKGIQLNEEKTVFLLGLRAGSTFGSQFNDDITFRAGDTVSLDYKVRFDIRPGGALDGLVAAQYRGWELSVGMGYMKFLSDQLSVFDENNSLVDFRSSDDTGDESVRSIAGRYEFVHLNYLIAVKQQSVVPFVGLGLGTWHYSSESGNQQFDGSQGNMRDSTEFLQGRLGVRYEISSEFSWGVSYQYRVFKPIKLELSGNTDGQNNTIIVEENIAGEDIMFGLYYRL